MTLKNGFGKCPLLFFQPIVLQYDVKAKYRLIARKFSGHEDFSPERSLNQPKLPAFCIRSINQSNSLSFRSFVVSVLFASFPFQGHTKIAPFKVSM